jgi:hypothetical protein
MPIALAGKLSIDDLAIVARFGADLLGVRSAVCAASSPGMADGDRLGVVSRAMVRRAVAALNDVAVDETRRGPARGRPDAIRSGGERNPSR